MGRSCDSLRAIACNWHPHDALYRPLSRDEVQDFVHGKRVLPIYSTRIRLPIANCVLLQKEGNRFRARHGMVLRSVQLPESLSR